MLEALLQELFPRIGALSLFLFHIVQFQYESSTALPTPWQQRTGYHASVELQAQIIQAIRRVLRSSDQVQADPHGTGAALLFPAVDLEGIHAIARRISASINLLQAETLVPPLVHETAILCGFASYPHPACSLPELLQQVSYVQEQITFRPAVLPRPQPARSRLERVTARANHPHSREARLQEARVHGIPFMQIPSRLPTRLQQIIPYPLALKLRCAPVGRNHNRLTVAMANPLDTQALAHLQTVTGMVIFPVSCELTALDTLLASGW
jgi:hypothetical protein